MRNVCGGFALTHTRLAQITIAEVAVILLLVEAMFEECSFADTLSICPNEDHQF